MPAARDSVDLFSAAILVTPKAAQPRGKAPLKALLRVELQVCVVLLSLCPGGEQSQPCRRNPRTQPAADGFILPFPDSRGIQRSSKALCQCTRKAVWQKCACATAGGCPDTGIGPLGGFFGHLSAGAAVPA